jgi:hypothetical protein
MAVLRLRPRPAVDCVHGRDGPGLRHSGDGLDPGRPHRGPPSPRHRFGGLLVGAALGRFKVLIMVPAALVMLLAGITAGYAGEAIISVVASQVGYIGFALAMAQKRTVST